MRCSSTAEFRKQKTCPSAEMLLLYKNAGLALERRQKIAAHLKCCDFCGAEMQLLSRHRSRIAAAPAATIEMPLSLRRLAEGLMGEPSMHRARFIETIYDLDRLTLTDA